MDLQSALICGAVFLFSAAVLLFISWIGIKQKSYEEALAEQRDLNSGLLETRAKLKLAKEKKQRKQEKRKNKEKVSTSSSSDITADEEVETKTGAKNIPSVVVKPGHVDFKEQPAVISTELQSKVVRKSKRDQAKLNVKPILINRDPSPVITYKPIDSPKTMNHFEIIQPKDEKELLKPQITEKKVNKKQKETEVEKKIETKTSPKPKKEIKPKEVVKKEPQPEVVKNKSDKQNGAIKVETEKKSNDKKKSPQPEKVKKVEEVLEVKETKVVKKVEKKKLVEEEKKKEVMNGQHKKKEENLVVKKDSPPIKKSKKDSEQVVEKVKKEQNGLQNGHGEGVEEIVMPVQTVTTKESKKRKRELNALQQMSGDNTGVNVSLLVPLIRKAELSRSEVQILIDLLLNKQHDTPSIAEEWFEGRSDPVVKLKKQLAERVKQFEDEQEAHAGVAAKLREVRTELNACLQAKRQLEDLNNQALNERQQLITRLQMNQEHLQAEKQMLQKQIQQLQSKLTDEKHMARQFKDEHSKLQSQRQQLEVAVNRLSEQHQENDNALKSQIGNLHKELQDQRNITASLRLDLHAVGTDADALRERLAILQPAAEQSQELARQLEDARRTINELEQRLSVTVTNAKVMSEKLNLLEESKSNTQSEVHNLQSEISRLHTLAKQKQDESDSILAQVRAELSTVQANATGSAENDKARQVEILNLHNELDSTKNELKTAKEQIEDEKTKNNELRERSWKVIEALKTAEKAKEDGVQLLNDTISKLKIENQEQNKQLLLRLFPEVTINSNLKYDKFITDYEKAIHSYITSKVIDVEMKAEQTQRKLKEQLTALETDNRSKVNELDEKIRQLTKSEKENQNKIKELEQKLEVAKNNDQKQSETKTLEFQKKLKELEENQKVEARKVAEKEKLLVDAKEEIVTLQETVRKYKTIIDDTESMLHKLEQNIGSGVTTMKAELIAKDEELKLKTVLSQKLQKQLADVTESLSVEQRRNQILVDECQKLKSKNLTNSTNSFHNHEDIKEKTSKLVAVEQTKTETPKNSIRPEKKLNSSNSNSSLGDSSESHSPPSPALSITSQTNSSNNKTKKKKSKK